MMLLTGLVGVLLVLTAEASVGRSEGTKCTQTKECLTYDLLCKTETYEVRRYRDVIWVSAMQKAFDFENALTNGLKQLDEYCEGKNSEGKKIDMTNPIVVEIPRKGIWKAGVYEISISLPSEHQENFPQPFTTKSIKMYIYKVPELTVYVQSYEGKIKNTYVEEYTRRLHDALDKAGAKYYDDHYFGVTYYRPRTQVDGHNEVWVEVLGKPVCPK